MAPFAKEAQSQRRSGPAHLADEVQQQLALRAHQARQQLRDPGQPLDGGHADAVLVHRVRQRVLVVIETQQPKHLRRIKRTPQALQSRHINQYDAQTSQVFY